MVSVQRVAVRGRSLSPEHAAQHGQGLNVTHLAVVVQTAEKHTHTHSSDAVPPEGHALCRDSQRLQQVAPKRVSGPGGLCVRVRIWAQGLTGGCRSQGPNLQTGGGPEVSEVCADFYWSDSVKLLSNVTR